MTATTYLRPVGRVVPPPFSKADDSRFAGSETTTQVGARPDLVFAALELIDRHADGRIERRIVSPAEVQTEIAKGGLRAERLREALAGIAMPRASLAGVPLDRPRIMGIVNVTPDSFSDGGCHADAARAIAFARRLDDEGADFLDIGGESTRPGSDPVPVTEELARVLPVIEALAGKVRAKISIDTRKAEVMQAAAAAGAHVINDVSALQHDPNSLAVAARTGLPVVLMHALGDPKTMQDDPRYDDVLLDVYDALSARIAACGQAGIPRERIVVDPGLGFGKTMAHNLELLAGLSLMHALGTPVLLGASRKNTIGRLTGATVPSERVHGSVAAALVGAMQGASLLRVHDVAETRQALAVWEAATRGTA